MTAIATQQLSLDRSWLGDLEDEAIHILREVVGQFERPVILFSGGKDSIVLLHLAAKAFWPGRVPFPIMHIDTGHNFPEVIAYRDRHVAELGVKLVVASVQDSIDLGRVQESPGQSRNPLQTVTLLDAIAEHGFDAVLGGARRDEEKSRAKERVFSVRSSGTSTTAGTVAASTCGSSRCRTGPNSTSGPTSKPRASRCRASITRTPDRYSSVTGCCSPLPNGPSRPTARSSPPTRCATAPWATRPAPARSARSPRRSRTCSSRPPPRRSPSAAPPVPTTAPATPRWKIASAKAISSVAYPAVRVPASPPLAALGRTRGSVPRLRRGPSRGGGALRASAHRSLRPG